MNHLNPILTVVLSALGVATILLLLRVSFTSSGRENDRPR